MGRFSEERHYGSVPIINDQENTPSLSRLRAALNELYGYDSRAASADQSSASSADATPPWQRPIKRTWTELRAAHSVDVVAQRRVRFEEPVALCSTSTI
jgi:hypothetical protein